MTTKLETILSQAGDPITWLRNQQIGPNAFPGVPAEFTNRRDEQRGRAETCVLFNQSYHMAELMVEPHSQVTIKAVVAPAPYSEVARTAYVPSWRTKAA
jgi:hypothetical protein